MCPAVAPGPVPHVGGPVSSGDPTVLIGFQPAARVGDTAVCAGSVDPIIPGDPPVRVSVSAIAVDTIIAGDPSVLIGDQPAARIGDPTAHGGAVAMSCPSVIFGSTPQEEALRTDNPFCEECEEKRKAREARRKKAST
jgi:uncharacterized Zn-binding protein involved in type VI secretion